MLSNNDKGGTKAIGIKEKNFLFCLRIQEVVEHLCAQIGCDMLTTKYLVRRAGVEGLPFVSIVLPSFEKSVLSFIENGTNFYTGITTKTLTKKAFRNLGLVVAPVGNGLYPFGCFLEPLKRGLREADLQLVADNLYKIRTLCSYFYKLTVEPTDNQKARAISSWFDCEADLRGGHRDKLKRLDRIRTLAIKLFPDIYVDSFDSILHKFPPRSTTGSFSGSGKFSYLSLPPGPLRETKSRYIGRRLRRTVYEGVSGFVKPYPSYKNRHDPMISKDEKVPYDHLLFVPKDSRGPRSITKCDRVDLMFQMSYFDYLCNVLNRRTRNRINFTDQRINQKLAKRGSEKGLFSTFDLKEASDRTIAWFIHYIFEGSSLAKFLKNFRNSRIQIPYGMDELVTILERNLDQDKFLWVLEKLEDHGKNSCVYDDPLKLAGMGSGFTFPTMSMLIYLAIVDEAMQNGISLRFACENTYVYGDDVVVHSDMTHCVSAALTGVGYKINTSKSYSNSLFRESCGADVYGGYDVTPLRLKLTNNVPDAGGESPLRDGSKHFYPILGFNGVVALERHCRELAQKGYNRLANYYYKKIESVIGNLPLGSRETPYLCRYIPESNVADLILDTYYGLNHDQLIDVHLPTPIKKRFTKRHGESVQSEYSYLSSYLKRNDEDEFTYDPTRPKKTFGEYDSPRQLRDVKNKKSPVELYGYSSKFLCGKSAHHGSYSILNNFEPTH